MEGGSLRMNAGFFQHVVEARHPRIAAMGAGIGEAAADRPRSAAITARRESSAGPTRAPRMTTAPAQSPSRAHSSDTTRLIATCSAEEFGKKNNRHPTIKPAFPACHLCRHG